MQTQKATRDERGVDIFDPTLADIKSESLQQVFGFWLRLKDIHHKPGRRHFSPLDLKSHLHNIMLIDYDRATDRFQYRLVGTALVEGLGIDLTGTYVDEAPDFDNPEKRFRWLLDNEKPYLRSTQTKDWMDDQFQSYDAVCCPLFDEEGQINMLFMAFDAHRHTQA